MTEGFHCLPIFLSISYAEIDFASSSRFTLNVTVLGSVNVLYCVSRKTKKERGCMKMCVGSVVRSLCSKIHHFILYM